MSNRNDELMARIANGDRDAFSELMYEWQGTVLNHFFRKTHDKDRSEDLAQETFLRVWSQAHQYQPNGMFNAWLLRVADNKLIDGHRRRKNDVLNRSTSGTHDDESEDMLSRMPVDEPCETEPMDLSEFAEEVDDLLDALPDDQRTTFILFVYADMSLSQIAEAMETLLPTAKSRLRLAREKLRERLAERLIADPMAA